MWSRQFIALDQGASCLHSTNRVGGRYLVRYREKKCRSWVLLSSAELQRSAGESRWLLFLSNFQPSAPPSLHSSQLARPTMTPSAGVLFLENQKG